MTTLSKRRFFLLAFLFIGVGGTIDPVGASTGGAGYFRVNLKKLLGSGVNAARDSVDFSVKYEVTEDSPLKKTEDAPPKEKDNRCLAKVLDKKCENWLVDTLYQKELEFIYSENRKRDAKMRKEGEVLIAELEGFKNKHFRCARNSIDYCRACESFHNPKYIMFYEEEIKKSLGQMSVRPALNVWEMGHKIMSSVKYCKIEDVSIKSKIQIGSRERPLFSGTISLERKPMFANDESIIDRTAPYKCGELEFFPSIRRPTVKITPVFNIDFHINTPKQNQTKRISLEEVCEGF